MILLWLCTYYLGLKSLTLLPVYFEQALSRSTSLIFASVHSQANTSANSSCLLSGSPEARAVASSPTSSINHINVAGIPLCWSRFLYFWAINRWNSLIFILQQSKRISAHRHIHNVFLTFALAPCVIFCFVPDWRALLLQRCFWPEQLPFRRSVRLAR